MIELMLKMLFWLVAAIGLGFIFGWLLAKAFQKRQYDEELDTLDKALADRGEMLVELEKKFRNEKVMSEKLSKELKRTEEALAEQIGRVTKLQLQLKQVSGNQEDKVKLEEQNQELHQQIELLKEKEEKRIKELEEFESVLLKAEEKQEEQQAIYEARIESLEKRVEMLLIENDEKSRTIELYQDTIAEFEKELKLYSANSEDDEFVISKDQFTKIEEQLEKYQKEITLLKKENEELMQKSREQQQIQGKQREEVEHIELDDGSIVKLFKETYKKITKS